MSRLLNGRSARVTAVVFGSAAVMALGAGAASATTILGGGATVASGSTVGGPLSGLAILNTGTGSATCTVGNLAGTVGTNPVTGSVPLTPTAFNLSTCSDTIPPFDILSASLGTPGTGSVAYNSSTAPQGTLSIKSPAIRVAIRTSSGMPNTCTFTINNSTFTAAGALTNATNQVAFVAVPVATTGLCVGANPAAFSATFKPLTVLSVPSGPPAGSAVVGSLLTVAP